MGTSPMHTLEEQTYLNLEMRVARQYGNGSQANLTKALLMSGNAKSTGAPLGDQPGG